LILFFNYLDPVVLWFWFFFIKKPETDYYLIFDFIQIPGKAAKDPPHPWYLPGYQCGGGVLLVYPGQIGVKLGKQSPYSQPPNNQSSFDCNRTRVKLVPSNKPYWQTRASFSTYPFCSMLDIPNYYWGYLLMILVLIGT
jgi:hypothetical protein